MAHLVYIDETVCHDATTGDPRFLLLVGLVVSEESVRSLAACLSNLTLKHLGYRPSDFEFHGNEIWGGQGIWKDKSPDELLDVFDDLIEVFQTLNLYICTSQIDLPKLTQKYSGSFDRNDYLLGLQFMLEKLNRYDSSKPLRILIADRKKEHELRAINLVSDMQWAPFQGEVPGIQLDTIIDSIHFVESKNSAGVQLADSIAFLLQRYSWNGDEHPNAKKRLFDLVQKITSRRPTYRISWP